MTAALLLVLDVVYRGLPVALAGGAIIAVYVCLWVILPTSRRRRSV